MQLTEVWAAAPGLEGVLEVSTFGRMRSVARLAKIGGGRFRQHRSKILKGSTDGRGVKRFIKYYADKPWKAFIVHRLIAEAFLGKPEVGQTVNHRDGNPSNNRIENLEWCSHKKNNEHAIVNGLMNPYGSDCITADEVKAIRVRLSNKEPVRAVSNACGVSYQVVWRIKHNVTWSYLE